MELLWQALRQVVFILDQVAYGLIPSAYELIFYMANVNLFNNDILSALVNRIYLLLGIFMLFKIAFSLIQYMIDPNTFDDKSKGFGKLITNTLVAMVLLVMTPFIFEEAYKIQGDIILSNVIPRLILGDESYGDYTDGNTPESSALTEKQAEIHSMGVDVQFTLFSAFYTLNTDSEADGYPACRPTSEAPLKNVIGSSDMLNDSECWGAVSGDLTNELHKNGGTVRGMFKYSESAATDDVDPAKCANGICDERDFKNFGSLLWWIKAGGASPFTITYIPIISAIVGGYLLLLLVSFVIDIATRVFKLLFLQMIAPIAIISYMDPKESVSNGKLHNWLVECGRTYVSLFLRLAVIYGAIQLVRVLLSSVFGATADGTSIYYNGVAPTGALNIFVYIFLILGIFTFAKKVPQMIENIFGIKLAGELSLNPFKNEGFKTMLGGMAIGGATLGAGLVNTGVGLGRMVGDTRNTFRSSRAGGEGMIESVFNAAGAATGGFRHALASGIGGMASGARRSVVGAARGEGAMKNFRNSFGSTMFARQQRDDLNRQGSRWYGRVAADVERNLGIMNAAQRQQLDYDQTEKQIKMQREAKTRAFSDYQKAASAIKSRIDADSDVKVATAARNNAQAALARAQATGDDSQIKAAKEARDKAFAELSEKKSLAYSKVESDPTAKVYFDTMEKLRKENAEIGAFDSISKKDKYDNIVFDDSSITQASNKLDSINYDFDMQQADLEARKNNPEWSQNELDNSSRGVTAPQPEGWMPHAGYGASGYMGWGDGPGRGAGDQ